MFMDKTSADEIPKRSEVAGWKDFVGMRNYSIGKRGSTVSGSVQTVKMGDGIPCSVNP